jgi:predicted dehydrogenase
MNAGKDVYVEKPLMFRREEGPEIIHTAKATGRVCQVGLQQRSGELFLRAKKEFVDSGLLGPVSSVRAEWNYSAPFDLGDANQPKPDTLNWDHFLGQVPYRAWNPHQYHHYRLFLDFGGAAITDLLTHWIDVVHMMLGQDSPRYVSSVGGIFVAKDDRTAPDTVSVIIEYPRFTVSFESTSLDGMPTEHLEFLGANGRLWLSRRKCQFISKDEGARPIAFEPPDMLVESHIRNFLDCCRSRRTPTCPPEVGELSARVCIAAKDAYVKRQQLPCAEST